jgi:hypothetical protein
MFTEIIQKYMDKTNPEKNSRDRTIKYVWPVIGSA